MKTPFAVGMCRTLIFVLSVAISASASAENEALVFTASDFPTLVRGTKLPRDGEYTVKVWSNGDRSWRIESNETTLTLASEKSQGTKAPSWTSLGTISLKGDVPIAIVVKDATFEPIEIVGDYRTQSQTVKDRPDSAPVPSVLSLAIDPQFTPDLALIRGRTDSTEPTSDARGIHVRTNHEGIGFHAPADPNAWRARARSVREQLRVTLGLTPALPKTALHSQVFGRVDRDGYTIEKVALETMPGVILAGNLYRPAGNCRRVPAILCPHGHWDDGRANPDVQSRCIGWAKLGCVVFLYDMVGYNDSKPFGHEFASDRLSRYGFSLPTLQTWNSLRALDWIATLPDVDPARIGGTGESGGGTQTFLLAALDPRIAVSAPVVMVSERFQGGCVCENAPGLRVGTDNVEIAALTAPRPMILVGATGDWTSNTTTKVHPAIRRVYETIGVPAHLEAELFDFPHNYNQTSRNAVYAFMARWLLNIDDAESTREGSQTIETQDDLLVFNDDHPAPSRWKTPESLENDLVALRDRQIQALAPGDDATNWEAARLVLSQIHETRVGIVNPPPNEVVGRIAGRVQRHGLDATHWVIGREDRGEAIPVVRLAPEKPSGRVAIVFHGRGKAGLISPSGEPAAMTKALLDRGVGVIGFDSIFVGEAFDPEAPADRRPSSTHFLTYNPSLAADRMQDLATVLAWSRSQEDIHEISLIGVGGAGPLVVLARPLLAGVARTFADLENFAYGDESAEIPEGLDLPGVLQFGGLKAATALTSPMPLWVARPGFETSWPTKAYAIAAAASALRVTAESPEAEAVARWIDLGDE